MVSPQRDRNGLRTLVADLTVPFKSVFVVRENIQSDNEKRELFFASPPARIFAPIAPMFLFCPTPESSGQNLLRFSTWRKQHCDKAAAKASAPSQESLFNPFHVEYIVRIRSFSVVRVRFCDNIRAKAFAPRSPIPLLSNETIRRERTEI